MEKHTLLIGGVIVVIIFAVSAVVFLRDAGQADDLIVEDDANGETVSATSSPDSNMPEQSERKEGVVLETPGSPGGTNVAEPDIAITPYSVYIGFATEVGTTTADVDAEVPKAVVGYEWEALPGSPHFSEITIPDWSGGTTPTKDYEVVVWNYKTDLYEELGEYPFGEAIDFPRDGINGIQKFKVLGIDPALRICPGDRSFTWEAKFIFEGERGLVRTPITQDLPEGETCEMR